VPAAVETTRLHKSYGDVHALRGAPLSAWRYRRVVAR
jgi:hypothetical protein